MLKLKPYCAERVWGGSKISHFFNVNKKIKFGEAWIASGLDVGSSSIEDNDLNLNQYFKKNQSKFNYNKTSFFPILIKIIDAQDDLSIQVHPNDEEAKRLEGQPNGKSECWYVLDCEKTSDILIGVNAKTKKEVTDAIDKKQWNKIFDFQKIVPGEFFDIQAGTVHAIRKHTLIYELQQPSDVTYRIYDYDRLQNGKPRELHLEKAKEVIKIGKEKAAKITTTKINKNLATHFIDNKNFGLDRLDINFTDNVKYYSQKPFIVLTKIDDNESKLNNVKLKKFDTLILFKNELEEGFEIIGKSNYLISWPN